MITIIIQYLSSCQNRDRRDILSNICTVFLSLQMVEKWKAVCGLNPDCCSALRVPLQLLHLQLVHARHVLLLCPCGPLPYTKNA
jgi:hypothetical protein